MPAAMTAADMCLSFGVGEGHGELLTNVRAISGVLCRSAYERAGTGSEQNDWQPGGAAGWRRTRPELRRDDLFRG